jgi:hypothetical protein
VGDGREMTKPKWKYEIGLEDNGRTIREDYSSYPAAKKKIEELVNELGEDDERDTNPTIVIRKTRI